MGRELKRKQAKKEGKVLKEEKVITNENPYNDIYKMLKTFGIILAIVLVIHFFTALVITKEIEWFSKDDDNSLEEVKVNNSILAKNVFMQTDDEYYVYFYDYNDENVYLASLVNGKLSKSVVYRVNTGDGLNSNYVTKDSLGNSTANSIENLKVINPTLIKISGDTIVEYYETKDNIVNYLEAK